jgi:hypothetical protein
MMDKIDDVPKSQFKALEEIEKEKIKIAKAYNTTNVSWKNHFMLEI